MKLRKNTAVLVIGGVFLACSVADLGWWAFSSARPSREAIEGRPIPGPQGSGAPVRQAVDPALVAILTADEGAGIATGGASEPAGPAARLAHYQELKSLSRKGDREALGELLERIGKREPGADVARAGDKEEAVAAIGRIRSPEASAAIRELAAGHADPRVRLAAINTLVANRTEGALGVLEEILRKDESRLIRTKAQWGIDQLKR